MTTVDYHNRISGNLGLEVSPEFLESIILYFKKLDYEIISLDQLYERLLHNSIEKPFVCFTFDDGYVDNYEIAYPVLKKHNIPFAIYVTTSFPDNTAILWWYMLEDIVLKSKVINFKYSNKEYSFHAENLEQKVDTFNSIRNLILAHPQRQIKKFIDVLFHKYDIPITTYNSLTMTWEQIVKLSNDPLVTIGAHTVNHLNLKQLSTEEVVQEIIISQKKIEIKIDKPVKHFAYPFGTSNEAGRREFEIVKNCHFKTATTTRCANIFSAHRNHLECLPRIPVIGYHQSLTILEMMLAGALSLHHHGLHRVVTE